MESSSQLMKVFFLDLFNLRICSEQLASQHA